MKNKKNSSIRIAMMYIYQLLMMFLVIYVYVGMFRKFHIDLNHATRTLAIVLIIFTVTYILMGMVYGKLEIGEKKNKPLFYSVALNLLITNTVTFVAMKVMTVHANVPLLKDIGTLFTVYLLQLITVRICVSIGNGLYFINYCPENVVIISNDSSSLNKIQKHFLRHKKQYEIQEILHQDTLKGLNYSAINCLVLLDVPRSVIQTAIEIGYVYDFDVLYNFDYADSYFVGTSSQVIDDILLGTCKANKLTPYQAFVKRLVDILFSLLALVAVSPIMLIIFIAIKVDDFGPAFYRQERLTKDGKVFKIIKFRSMKQNAGDRPVEVGDTRITRVGHIIRKIRLDELPQLLNILMGDMSIVGPRPESVVIINRISEDMPEFKHRLKVKAGLTGYAQIFGKYNTEPKNKLIFDLYYIENYSLINDMRLMLQTLIVFLKKDSTEAYEANNIRT